MKNVSTEAKEKFKERLHEAIKTNLVQRGFHAPFTVSLEERKSGNTVIEIESESFQTVPVIFKDIKIVAFSSNVRISEEHSDVIEFFVSVNIRYKHFDRGENGCELFLISGKYNFDIDVIQWEIRGR